MTQNEEMACIRHMITMQMVCAVTSQQGRYHGTMQMGCAVTSEQSNFLHREMILSRLPTSPS